MGQAKARGSKDQRVAEAVERASVAEIAHKAQARAGRKAEAEAAVPEEYIDLKSLMGPPARIKQRYKAWEDCGATSLTVRSAQEEAMHVMAEAARLNQPR